jgi:hypothetical protein
MFSPPRPMMSPTLRCGIDTVAATSTCDAASLPQPLPTNGDKLWGMCA